MTPRTVVFALMEIVPSKTLSTMNQLFLNFQGYLFMMVDIEKITGIVMTKKIFKQALKDDSVKLSTIQKDIYKINENIPVSMALDLFIKKKEHMFLVLDSYDQTEGIVTLEDCVETILGVEIVDESDSDADMREVAKRKMRLKRRLDKYREIN